MFSFQSSLEENAIWINFQAPTFCLLKIISLLIITKSAENLKLLWFETWHTSFPWFYFILLLLNVHSKFFLFFLWFPFLKWKLIKLYFQDVQVLCALFILTSSFKINCFKIGTMSVVQNLVLAEILCVLFSLTSSFSSTWKKDELFFSHMNERKTCGLVQQLILHSLRDYILW